MPIVEEVFDRVRRAFIWTPDKENFGQDDYWTSLKAALNAGETVIRGDCDDFAMTCLDLLLDAGEPRHAMRMMLCWVETGEYHAVSGIDVDDTTMIFDCRQRRVMDFRSLPYRWDRGMRLSEAPTWRTLSAA
jgi:predicted transglutaminase-like cysteine proteinase